MVTIRVYNSFDGEYNSCINSPNLTYKSFFRLEPSTKTGKYPSLAAHVSALYPDFLIGEDASADHEKYDSPFMYFEDSQRDRIKSYLAFKAVDHGHATGDPMPVIVCDSPSDCFKESNQLILKQMAKIVRTRLAYEFKLGELMTIGCPVEPTGPPRVRRLIKRFRLPPNRSV